VPDGAGGVVAATNLLGIAADTLTTSSEDLTRWVLALRAGAVGGVAVTSAMAERTRLRDGTLIHYGLGLAVRRYRGLTVLCHSGSQPGYKAHIAYVPERDVGVVILSNREDTRRRRWRQRSSTRRSAATSPDRIPPPRRGDASPAPASRPSSGPRSRGATSTSTGASGCRSRSRTGVLRGETSGDPVALYHEGGGVFRDAGRLPGDRPRRAPDRAPAGGAASSAGFASAARTSCCAGTKLRGIHLRPSLPSPDATRARRSTAGTWCACTVPG
jgi:hypothetical protein